jgi:hypothetical protein
MTWSELVRKAGIEVDYAILTRTEREGKSVERVTVWISGDLTFEMLSKASELMDTRKIDIACDLGCESDRSHDTKLIFWDPSPRSEA